MIDRDTELRQAAIRRFLLNGNHIQSPDRELLANLNGSDYMRELLGLGRLFGHVRSNTNTRRIINVGVNTERANTQFAQTHLAERLQFLAADTLEGDIADESVGGVITLRVLNDNPVPNAASLTRVLETEGVFKTNVTGIIQTEQGLTLHHTQYADLLRRHGLGVATLHNPHTFDHILLAVNGRNDERARELINDDAQAERYLFQEQILKNYRPRPKEVAVFSRQ